MKLHSFTVGPFQENTYLLVKQDEALLIDPGFSQPAEVRAFQQKLIEEQADLKAVVVTHAHVDHLLGLHDVLNVYSVPVYLSAADRNLWKHFSLQAQMYGLHMEDFNFDPEDLPIQPNWSLGAFHFDVIHTPGHAPDHVSLYNGEEQKLMSGRYPF